jgi:hypothetical protein
VRNGRARSELMQWVAPLAEANAFSDAGTSPQLALRIAALCEQAGVCARPQAPPAGAISNLETLWELCKGICEGMTSTDNPGGTGGPTRFIRRGKDTYTHRRALRRLGIKKLRRLTFLGFVAVTSNSSN